MKNYEKLIQDTRYPIDGNGYVLDDQDALEAARLAFNEALDEVIQLVAADSKVPIGIVPEINRLKL